MISSSLVRTTYTPMRLSSLEMRGPWWALRSGSSLMPSQPQCSLMAWRMAGILAHAGGEDDGVDAVHGATQAGHALGHAPGEVGQGQFRAGRVAGQQLAHVVADAGQALHAAVVIEQVLDLVMAHAAFHHPQHHAGSSRPGRVPMGRPSSAVKPMVLSTLLPWWMAQADTPEQVGGDDLAHRDFGQRALQALGDARRTGHGSRSAARPAGTAIRAGRSGRPPRNGCDGRRCRSRRPGESRGGARGSRGWAPGCWAGAAEPAGCRHPAAPGCRHRSVPARTARGRRAPRDGPRPAARRPGGR